MESRLMLAVFLVAILASIADGHQLSALATLWYNKSSASHVLPYPSVEEGEREGLKLVESMYGDWGREQVVGYTQMENSAKDINNPKNTAKDLNHPKSRHKRAITANQDRYWPKAVIPYTFEDDVPEDERYETLVAQKRMERYTCLKYVPYVANVTRWEQGLPDEAHMLHVKRKGCWAFLGNNHSPAGQKISCCDRRACAHELSHILGIFHDQSSPLRHGWLRINWQNVPLKDWGIFKEEEPETTLSFRYDVNNIMHYSAHAFTDGPWPSMTVLSKDIEALINMPKNHFYNYQEIVVTNQCKERHCPDFPECMNDGFVSYIENRCRCMCPPGLDPDTQCKDVIKKVNPPSVWPSGSFSFLSASGGCPSDVFSALELTTEDTIYVLDISSDFHLDGNFSTNQVDFVLCLKNLEKEEGEVDWTTGQYCIMADSSGNCPTSFNVTDVIVPEFNITLCCRDDGFSEDPVYLPIDTPFTLFPPSKAGPCQDVEGMYGVLEMVNLRTGSLQEQLPTAFPIQADNIHNRDLTINYCYYQKKDMDCGGFIELSEDNKETTVTSPGYPSAYQSVMECYWLIKSPVNTTFVLHFDDFEVGEASEDCEDDYVILRHALLGQNALKHCGNGPQQSYTTFDNAASIFLSTNLTGQHKGFKVTAKLIIPGEHCYNMKDKGASYRGKVNFTKDYLPCLSWDRVTECPHHAFNSSDFDGMLEENYCRNPDNSLQPWCYTRTYEGQCDRNYCDVCRYEQVFDNQPDCAQLKQEGLCDGDLNQAMSLCAKTCDVPLAQREEPIKCNKPPVIQDGILTFDRDSYEVGETVTHTCPYGADVITRRCHSDGSWSPGNYVCGVCSNDWSSHKGACYKYFPYLRTYTQARDFCALHNSFLASPQTEEELEYIVSLRPKLREIWLGAVKKKWQEEWISTDDLKVNLNKWTQATTRKGATDKVECALIRIAVRENKFHAHDCEERLPFVCKRYPSPRRVCVNRRWDCHDLVRRNPDVCNKFPDFAWQQCPFTCGHCQNYLTPYCKVTSPSSNVTVDTKVAYLPRGQVINYACANGTELLGGDLSRICEDSGWLSGKVPICGVPQEGETPNNMVSLVARPGTTSSYRSYIGNSALHRIHKEGEITKWSFYAKDHGTTGLQIWRPRPDLGPEKFEFIGHNEVATLPNRVTTVNIPWVERIHVLPGDVIGIWSADPVSQILFSDCGARGNPSATPIYELKETFARYPQLGSTYDVNLEESSCKTFSLTAYVNKSQHLLSRTGMFPLVNSPGRIRPNSGRIFSGDNNYFRIRSAGFLIQWRVFSQAGGNVSLQVWRAENAADLQYELIGENMVTLDDVTTNIYDIPGNEQIQVQEGDIIGLLYPEEPGVITFQQCDLKENPGAAALMYFTIQDEVVVGDVLKFTKSGACRVYALQAVIEEHV